MEIALATYAERPQLYVDEQLIVPILAARGIRAVPVVWTDPGVDWGRYSATLVRSTWDYHRRRSEFLEWVDRVDRVGPLWNPRAVLRWNTHKGYLEELAREGIATIPTRTVHGAVEVARTLEREGWSRAVLKPAVSADGWRTFVVGAGQPLPASIPWRDGERPVEFLLQPYFEAVERSGEHSLMHFAGAFSHAVVKTPMFGPAPHLVHGAPYLPRAEERRLAERALAAAPGPTLYARVDMVDGPDGTPRLMELELTEPSLFLASAPGIARRFVEAIVRCLGAP
jgi:hypothetical protein